jgi:sodium-dependent dicarboxylate transporter 2/3/5
MSTASIMKGKRATIGAVLAPAMALVLWLAPLPLDTQAHRLAAIFSAIIVLWVTEALPIAMTALLIAPALVITGIADAKTAFAPYADPLLFLFVGGFMIAKSMMVHGLDRRLALGLVSQPLIATSPARVRAAFVVAGVALSMWISNTATTAMLMPLVSGLFEHGDDREADPLAAGSLLLVAYSCSIGGLATPVGSPPNLIAMRFLIDAGYPMSFVDWVKVALPVSLVLALLAYVVLDKLHPAGRRQLEIRRDRGVSEGWSRGQLTTAMAFTLAALGWMAPGVAKALDLPGAVELGRALPAGGVALFAASVLFIVPDRTRCGRVLGWHDAAQIDWGIIMLFGGGLSLGRQMLDTGLASAISRGFVAFSGVQGLWTLTTIVAAFTIIFTEACSNTATSNMLAPLVIGIANELEVSPVPPVLAMGLAASCAFMLPIATGPNAIAYGTGRVGLPTMMRSGAVLNVVCCAALLVLVRLLVPYE